MMRNSTKNRSRTPYHSAEHESVARLAVGATTAWEVYNDCAFETDKERIKDWNDSLNTLLIFATLFSAVLTAFIMESMKIIQPDSSDTMRDILLTITRQFANNSIPPFEPTPFIAPAYAVRVNYYFFVSISSSLIAALGAVLALQWVGSYDAGLNQSSPEDRALQRHYRYQGIQKWKLEQIISSLPALVYLALFLFFVGLSEWLWQIHQGVAGVIIAGLICGSSFVLITTVISMIYVGAPFRTPASRSLPRIFAGLYCSLVNLISQMSVKEAIIAAKNLKNQVHHLMQHLRQLWSKHDSALARLNPISDYLKSPFPIGSFESREKRHVQSIPNIRRAALLWLMNSMDVLPHTANQFRSIVQEVLLLPASQLIDSGIEQAPWQPIFSLLLGPYLKRDPEMEFLEWEVRDLEPILQAFSLVWNIPPSNKEFDSLRGFTLNDLPGAIRHSVSLAFLRRAGKIDYFIGQLCSVLGAIGTFRTEFLVSHLLRLQEWQKLQPDQQVIDLHVDNYDRESGRSTLSEFLSFDLTATTASSTIPDIMMNILLDILALRFNRVMPLGMTALERYMSSVKMILKEENDPFERNVAMEIHDAVLSQLLGKMLRRNRHPEDATDDKPVLTQVDRLLHAKPWFNANTSAIQAVFEILQHNFGAGRLWNPESRLITARIYARILPGSYSFSGKDWREWRTQFYLGLDRLLRGSEGYLPMSQQLVRNQAEFEARWHHQKPELSASQVSRLSVVKDPIIRLYASVGTSPRWVYPSSVRAARGSVEREAWVEALGHWCASKREELNLNHSELTLIRSIISISTRPSYRKISRPIDSVPTVKGTTDDRFFIMRTDPIFRILSRLGNIQTVDGNAMVSSTHILNAFIEVIQSSASWYSVLQQPVLELLLHGDSRIHPHAMMGILIRVCVHDWFFEEFRAAGGFSWLSEKIVPRLLEKAAAIICLSLELTDYEEEVVTWMDSLYQCLTSTTTLTHPRYTMRDPHRFIDAIDAIYAAQYRCRIINPALLARSNSSSTIVTVDDPLTPTRRGSRHTYVQRWSDDRWERWREMKEEISGGLCRGFIEVGPSISSARYIRDPDGCWSRL